jgi:hypothetical protein
MKFLNPDFDTVEAGHTSVSVDSQLIEAPCIYFLLALSELLSITVRYIVFPAALPRQP